MRLGGDIKDANEMNHISSGRLFHSKQKLWSLSVRWEVLLPEVQRLMPLKDKLYEDKLLFVSVSSLWSK